MSFLSSLMGYVPLCKVKINFYTGNEASVELEFTAMHDQIRPKETQEKTLIQLFALYYAYTLYNLRPRKGADELKATVSAIVKHLQGGGYNPDSIPMLRDLKSVFNWESMFQTLVIPKSENPLKTCTAEYQVNREGTWRMQVHISFGNPIKEQYYWPESVVVLFQYLAWNISDASLTFLCVMLNGMHIYYAKTDEYTLASRIDAVVSGYKYAQSRLPTR